MLEDLVTDTDKLAQRDEEIADVKQQMEQVEIQNEPLRMEMARVARDNSQLHQQLVLAEEEANHRKTKFHFASYELESENRRLKLVNQKSVELVKRLQRENDKLKTRLQHAIAAPPLMKNPELFESDGQFMREKGNPKVAADLPVTKSDAGDLVAVELSNLRTDCQDALRAVDLLHAQVAELQEGIRLRDAEIARLGRDLEHERGTNGFAKSLTAKVTVQRLEIEKQQAQIKVLTSKNAALKETLSNDADDTKVGGTKVLDAKVDVSIQTEVVTAATAPRLSSVRKSASKVVEPELQTSKDEEIAALTSKVARMTADFAFVHDTLATVVAEKDAVIRALHKKGGAPVEVLVDSDGIAALEKQILDIQAGCDREIARRDRQIQLLQNFIQSRSPPGTPQKCKQCSKLRKQLKAVEQHAQEEIQRLRNEITQSPVAKQNADRDLDRVRQIARTQQNELKECQRKLAEAESKIQTLPDVEQRYKSAVEQLRNEHIAMRSDLKQKTVIINSLTAKLTDAKRRAGDLQRQLQKTRDDSHEPNQGENALPDNLGGDPNAQLQLVQEQLHEKIRESNLYERLLDETKRQMAPLMETRIPQLKAQVAKLQKERDQNVRRTRRVVQLAESLEQTESEWPEAIALLAAIRQLKTDVDG
jgi:DNA repair exonuclease SbcCD ATPase subunit